MFATSNERTRFFSNFDFWVNTASLLTQLFVFGRLFKWAGLRFMLAAVPLLMMAGYALYALVPTFGVLAAVLAVRRVGEYAITRPSRDSLFTVVSREEKYKAKSLIDTLIYRGGDHLIRLINDLLDLSRAEIDELDLFPESIATRAFLPLLGTDRALKGQPGRIVNVSSVGGKVAAPFIGAYAASKHALEGAVRSLIHRGPDNQSVWLSPDQRVGLGHTRLSIIDLTTGDQPIANESERVHIVVNGEFYDFERQRGELEQRGHRFRTRSDSEIALHLYEDFGTHCVRRLRGEFAFVLWDESNDLLLAARDRFGIKPLYYAVHDDALYLASEVKALFAAGVPARWDHEYFYQHATGPAMPDRTLFEGVHQVPPGHYLIATRNSLRVQRYWEFDYTPAAELAASKRDERSYVEEFVRRARLRRAKFKRADSGIHSYVRSGRLRRGRHRARDGGARRRKFLPNSDQTVGHRRPLCRRDLALRNRLQQRPRRIKVSAQPRGARCRLQGRLYRRRFG